MDDQKKYHEEKDETRDKVVTRRSFLTSLGKWSSIVVATAAVGFSEAMGSDRPKEEFEQAGHPRSGRESLPGDPEMESDDTHPQWCRVWGHGCRVWGHGRRRRLWGNGCRVWGNRW
jgi:hypothetical protein